MAPERNPCPYLEENDYRCDRRLQLTNLPEAFGFCLAQHRACAIYQQLRRERQETPQTCELVTTG